MVVYLFLGGFIVQAEGSIVTGLWAMQNLAHDARGRAYLLDTVDRLIFVRLIIGLG